MRVITGCSFLVFAIALIASPLSAQIPVATPGALADGAVPTDLQLRLVGVKNTQIAGSSGEAKEFTIEVTNASGAGVADAAIVFRLPDSGVTGTFADGTHASVVYTDQAGRANIPNIQWSSMPGVVPIRISATKGTAHAGVLFEQTLIAMAPASRPAPEPGVLATAGTPLPVLVPSLQLPSPPVKPWDPQPSAQPGTPTKQPDNVTRAANTSPQAPSAPPAVTVTGGSPGLSTHSNKKWIIIAAIAVGAGVGLAVAMGHSKSSSTPSTSTTTIGAPSVTVGQ